MPKTQNICEKIILVWTNSNHILLMRINFCGLYKLLLFRINFILFIQVHSHQIFFELNQFQYISVDSIWPVPQQQNFDKSFKFKTKWLMNIKSAKTCRIVRLLAEIGDTWRLVPQFFTKSKHRFRNYQTKPE